MQSILLDVVEEPWLQRNGRDIIILSLMALVAIGIIVDDAIMVLENIFRYNEQGRCACERRYYRHVELR